MNVNKKIELFENIEGLKKFKNDFNNPKLNLWDFIKYKSDFDLAFAFCKLFFPEFIEVESCVLLAEKYESETFEKWKNTLNGNSRQLEATLNHTHIYDLFSEPDNSEEVSLEICEEIGKYIVKSWAISLKETFPEKKFDINFSTEPDDYGPTITFSQSEQDI
jgi:hypothetical protein